MTIPCPCCRAGNDTAVCRRCRADLSLLVAIESRREYLLDAARAKLARGEDALPMIEDAAALRNGNEVTQLRAIAALLRRDYQLAMALHSERRV